MQKSNDTQMIGTALPTADFKKKAINSKCLHKCKLLPRLSEPASVEASAESGEFATVLAMEYGKSYELRFPPLMQLAVLSTDADPRHLREGEQMQARKIRVAEGKPEPKDLCGLLYTPSTDGEFLLVFEKGGEAPIGYFEHTVLAPRDFDYPWYKPKEVSDFLGNEGSFADYRWTSDEIYEKLYEPMRSLHPDYIKREHIGKDQSGQYDMYCYIFEPKHYTETVFLCAGVHANEEEAYFALAYFMRAVAEADGTEPQLSFLKERVRFVVIPLVNVYGIHQVHDFSRPNWRIRYNCTETDLNRDFGKKTQRETQNVCAAIEKYAKHAAFGIDFHTTPNDNGTDLFFNFNVAAENTHVNLFAANHVYHRMKADGRIAKKRPLLIPSSASFGNLCAMDGSYAATSTLQTYLWNEHKILPITIEYMTFTSGKSPKKGSAEGLSFAVEILASFVIANARFFAKRAEDK